MTLIGLAETAIESLKTIVIATLKTSHDPQYIVKVLMRPPEREDGNYVAAIIPTRISPSYPVMNRAFENGLIEIRLILIARRPFDDDGTMLFNHVEEMIEALKDARTTRSYGWDIIEYDEGIRFDTADIIDNWVFQGAEFNIKIRIN